MREDNESSEPVELPEPEFFGFPRAYRDTDQEEREEKERTEFDSDFERWLDRSGFTETLRAELAKVHADMMNWDEAGAARSRLERNARGESESLKIEFLDRMETTIENCRRRYRFLDCGDGRVNGFRYRMKDGPVIWRTENDPGTTALLKKLGNLSGKSALPGNDVFGCRKAGLCMLDDASDLGSVAAEFVIRFLNNDFEYFEEVARLLAIRGGKRGGKRNLPMGARLIAAAEHLKFKLERNPTREELKDEAKRQGIKVGDWTKTLKDCKLDFLKGRRGRPRKNPG